MSQHGSMDLRFMANQQEREAHEDANIQNKGKKGLEDPSSEVCGLR